MVLTHSTHCLAVLLGLMSTFVDAVPAEAMLADDLLIDQASPPLSLKQDVTEKGCRCKSKCGASLDTGLAACDWCWTEGTCGQISFRGLWDYCVYPKMQTFEAQSHNVKQAQLWGQVAAAAAVGKSVPAMPFPKVVAKMLTESMITTFDDHWEVLPAGRSKIIHTQGVHCQFDLSVSPQSPFTGILAPGTQKGMIRMGSAGSLEGPGLGMFPGMGIKFLRSGVRSADFVALRTAGPGGSYNFFDSVFSNHVTPPPALEATHKFQQASGCPNMVGLSDVCSHTQAGQQINDPNFPFEILFEPTGNITFADVNKTNAELLHELSSIPVGSPLFDVYTHASPMDQKQGVKKLLGTLSTASECVQSLFGDSKLYYRHQRMEEDFALRPEWIKDMDGKHCVGSSGPISRWQCAKVPGQQWAKIDKQNSTLLV